MKRVIRTLAFGILCTMSALAGGWAVAATLSLSAEGPVAVPETPPHQAAPPSDGMPSSVPFKTTNPHLQTC